MKLGPARYRLLHSYFRDRISSVIRQAKTAKFGEFRSLFRCEVLLVLCGNTLTAEKLLHHLLGGHGFFDTKQMVFHWSQVEVAPKNRNGFLPTSGKENLSKEGTRFSLDGHCGLFLPSNRLKHC